MHERSKTTVAPVSDVAMLLLAHRCCVHTFFFLNSCRLKPYWSVLGETAETTDSGRNSKKKKKRKRKKKRCKMPRLNLITNPKISEFSKRTYAPFFTSIFSSLSHSLCFVSLLGSLLSVSRLSQTHSVTDALKLTLRLQTLKLTLPHRPTLNSGIKLNKAFVRVLFFFF